jgi:enoyl-[acyl-carrier protein] reductase I
MKESCVEGLLSGKRGLIFGVANDKSIAWFIANACHKAGAELAFTYQNDVLLKRITPLADSVNSSIVLLCDVSDENQLDAVFTKIEEEWGSLDFVVHAVAYSEKEQLKGRYVDVTRDNFTRSLDISCYSFTSIARRAEVLMPNGGSLLTLTYYGAEKVIPHYNVMGVAKAALESSVRYLAADLGKNGIRVNSLSAGPMKTLASSAIGDFRYILKWNEYNAPLRRNVTDQDVGNSALYLLSDLSAGVSGETHHVDCGYHATGMRVEDSVGLI